MGQVITKATQAQLFPRFVLLGQVEFASDLTLPLVILIFTQIFFHLCSPNGISFTLTA